MDAAALDAFGGMGSGSPLNADVQEAPNTRPRVDVRDYCKEVHDAASTVLGERQAISHVEA